MEHYEKEIKTLLKKIVSLLQENDEVYWASTFQTQLDKLISNAYTQEIVKEIIDNYKGGMGSFSDLVLQKNMQMLIKENDRLANLKHELYNACLNFLRDQDSTSKLS
jgi:hypothetical protein